MPSRKKIILSHILKYSSANYISQFLGFFTAIFMRNFLGPLFMGIWGMLRIVLEFANYANLGTIATVLYKLPLLKGKGEDEKANILMQVVFSFIIITSFVCAVGVAVYALIFRQELSMQVFIGLLATSVMLILQRLYTYHIGLLQAHKDFSVLSRVVVFDALVNLSLVLLIVSRFSLYGLYFVVIAMPVLNMIFIRRYTNYKLKLSLDIKELIECIRYGFPIFASGILQQLLNNVDRIMIVSMLGLKQLGFYSIAILARSYSSGLAKNFGIVIQPYFLEDFGESSDIQRSSRQVVLFSTITGYFMAGFLSIVFIVSPAFITYILPKFTPGITALRWYLVTTFFASILSYSTTFLVALGKQKKLVPIMLLAVVINIFLNYILIKAGYGISGAALATAVAAFASFIIVFVYALGHSAKISQILKHVYAILLPVAYSAVVLGILGSVIRYPNIALEALFKSLIFVVCFLPLIYYLDKKTGIVKVLIRMLISRFRKSDTERGGGSSGV